MFAVSFISSCSRSPADQYCNGPRTPTKPQLLSPSRTDPRRKSSMKPKNPSPDGVSPAPHRIRESKSRSSRYHHSTPALLKPDFVNSSVSSSIVEKLPNSSNHTHLPYRHLSPAGQALSFPTFCARRLRIFILTDATEINQSKVINDT